MTVDADYEEFVAWKRARDKNQLEETFYLLEQSLEDPSKRQFNCVMPSLAYRTLANAILALKRELIDAK